MNDPTKTIPPPQPEHAPAPAPEPLRKNVPPGQPSFEHVRNDTNTVRDTMPPPDKDD